MNSPLVIWIRQKGNKETYLSVCLPFCMSGQKESSPSLSTLSRAVVAETCVSGAFNGRLIGLWSEEAKQGTGTL